MDGHSVTVGDVTFQRVNGESHHDLVEAVRQKMWGSVRELLEADVDATTRSWAVQEAISHASDGQLLYILPHCTDDQVDTGVREAVRRDMWGTVGELLARIKTDKTCRWAVEQAAKRAMDEQLVSIIQYCTDDQVDAVFREAVDRHQWQSVLYLLGRGFTDTQKQWAVEEASKQAEDDELCPLLLHCTDDQLDSVVTQLVTQRRWECVLNLLQRGLPDSLCELILGEASQHAAEYQLLSLLSFCPDSQYDCVLMQIIQRGCWRAVDHLLQRSVDDQRIRCAIEKSTEPWDEDEFDTAVRVALKYEAWTFISHALDQQRDISESTCKLIVQNMNENNRENSGVTVAEEDTAVNQATSSLCTEKMQPVSSDHRSLLTSAVLKLVVSKHMWPTVLQLLGGSKCAFAVEEAMKHASDDVLEQILPHCTDDQVESALHVAVSRRLWFAVSELLQRPVSDANRAWTVEEARINAEDSHLEAILPHCTDDQLGLVFDTAVCRHLWSVIGQLSLRPVDNIRLAWAVKEAVQHADDHHLAIILPHCPDDQLDSSLMAAVTRGLWDCGKSLMRRRRDVFQRGRLEVDGKHVLEQILPHCTDDKVESVLHVAVSRRLWFAVSELLQRPVSDTKRAWAVEEAKTNADDSYLEAILPHCTDDQLDSSLMAAVTRGLWDCGESLMRRRRDLFQRGRLEVVGKHMSDEHVLRLLNTVTVDRGRECDKLFTVLLEAVTRQLWNGILKMTRSLPLQQRKWVVVEASKLAHGEILQQLITNYATNISDALGPVLQNLISRDLWSIACFTTSISGFHIRRRRLSHTDTVLTSTQQLRILEEASKRASGDDLEFIVSRLCTRDCVGVVFPHLLERQQWRALSIILDFLTPTQAKQVLKEVGKHADEPTLKLFLDCCPDELFDYAFTLAVKRGFWNTVTDYMQLGQAFRFSVFSSMSMSMSMRHRPSEKVRKLAVEEAMKRAAGKNFTSIATCCTDDQLEAVFAEAVTRRLWDAVDQLLTRGVKNEQMKWAVTEASKYANEVYTLKLIRNRHCVLMEIKSVLPQAVRRGMWKVVAELLERSPSIPDTERRWAVEEALRNASDEHLNTILCYCADDHLEVAVREAVKRRMWHCVVTLFVRGLTDELQEWVLEKVIKYLSHDQVLLIAPHCADSVSDFILTELVTRHLWDGVLDFLTGTTTPSKQSWAISEASKYAPESDLLRLLAYSSNDQLDSILTETVKRRIWTCVSKVLKRDVSCAHRKWALEETSKEAPEHYIMSLLQHVDDNDHCILLTETVRRRMWRCVGEILERGVQITQQEWALAEASKHASETQLLPLLQYVTDAQLCPVLTTTVRTRKWRCVGEILERGVDVTQQEWALAETSKHASETQLLPLLQYVTDAQLCPVLTTAVGKHMWSCVAELLKRGVDAEHRKWAVEEASRHALEESLLALLPHCPDDELDTVFKETVKRRQWRVVNVLLDGPLEGQRKVSLRETTQQMKLNWDIELRKVMQQNDWATVSFMLECFTVSAFLRRQAVREVCNVAWYHYARCNDNDFISIIQHCDHTQLMTVLQAAVERNLPHTACDILTRLGQQGEPGALTENGRAILLAVMDMKNGRQKLVAECMKLGITTDETEDTNRSRLLGSYNVDILRKDCPFRRAVLDNNIVIARMLYECGVCSNTDIQKLCNDFAVWEVQSELFQATFQNMSMFLKDKASTPRSLMSMCRLVTSRHLGVGCIRQEKVKQLPLPEPLRDYVVFPNIEGLAADDVTDDDATPDGDVIEAALLDVQTKLAPMRTYDSDDYGGFDSDCYDYDYYDYDNDYWGYDSDTCYGYDSDGW